MTKDKTRSDASPTISIRPYLNEDTGSFSVELYVNGLRTAAAAEKLSDMLIKYLGGEEFKMQ